MTCVYVWLGAVWVEWMRELGLGFTNPVGTGGVLGLCLCFDCDGVGGVVVVRLPRPMEGNGATPIFRSLQNCQFHHRRLESLEHLMCLIYIYILLSTTLSHFWTLRMPFSFTRSPFCIHFNFASTLCMCVMYLTSI